MSGQGAYINKPLGIFNNSPTQNTRNNSIDYNKFKNLIDNIFNDFEANLSIVQSFASFHVLQKKTTSPNVNVSRSISFAGYVADFLKLSKHPAIKILGSMLKFGSKRFPKGQDIIVYDLVSPHGGIEYFLTQTKSELNRYRREIADNILLEFKKAKKSKNSNSNLVFLYKELDKAFFNKSVFSNKVGSTTGLHNAMDEFTLLVIFDWMKVMSSSKYRPFLLLEKSTMKNRDVLPILTFVNTPTSVIHFFKKNLKNLHLLDLIDYSNSSTFFDFKGNTSKLFPIYFSWGGKNPSRPIGSRLLQKAAFLSSKPPSHTRIFFKLPRSYFYGGNTTWIITEVQGRNTHIHFKDDLFASYRNDRFIYSYEQTEWFRLNGNYLPTVHSTENKPILSLFGYYAYFRIKDFNTKASVVKLDLQKIDRHYYP